MNAELGELLSRGKDIGLHWFPEEVSLSTLATTLVGMANTQGGSVLLGIAPRSTQVIGVSDPQAALERVFQAGLLAEPTLVLPIPRIVSIETGDQTYVVLWVTVPAGLPHVYMLEGRYLGREGSQTNPLSARRLHQVLSERWVEPYEGRLMPEAGLDDLDSELVLDYYRLVHGRESAGLEPSYEFLHQRGCVLRKDGQLQPTIAALLLFGRNPQQYLAGATILAAHFPEANMSDVFIKKDLTGSLPDQLHQAETFVRANLDNLVRMQGLVREEVPQIPLDAVREVLVNAVAHRDYSIQGDNIHLNIFADRLEVHSPGSLPGPVTLENLLEARFSRNPVVVQVLSDLGFVERLGYGLKRTVQAMQKAGLRPPRFEEIGGTFRVTLYNQAEVNRTWLDAASELPPEVLQSQDFNLRQRTALGYLVRHPRITSSVYQELCPGVHTETLRRDLAELVSRGILIKVGDKKATYYILKKKITTGK